MPIPDKFCLKWTDFQDYISSAFESLREDTEFSDVTLICEDGEQVEAQRVILAALSTFFKAIFRKNKHAHSFIYVQGVKSEDIVSIVDFLYYGEANIYQSNLERFLNLAEELNLKGLNREEAGEELSEPIEAKHIKETKIYQQEINLDPLDLLVKYSEDSITAFKSEALAKMEFKDLDDQLNSMMALGKSNIPDGSNGFPRATICRICGNNGRRSDVETHIEGNHIEGISIPCSSCQKTSRTRIAFRKHIKLNHNTNV